MSKEKAEKPLHMQVDEYLIQNPIERGKPGAYADVADIFGVNSEYIRDRHRKLRSKNLITEQKNEESSLKENVKTGEADFVCITTKRIKTLEDLVKACDIDLKIWDITSYEVNKWEVGRKNKEVNLKWNNGVSTGHVNDKGNIFVEPLFQVKAKLSRRKLDRDLGLQKEAVMSELRAYKPSVDVKDSILKKLGISLKEFQNGKKNCALEINIPDLHIGKLAWGEETGDDYDIKIAVSRYKDAVAELLSRTNISDIDKFILVVGHDFLNVDGKNNLTTAGTPQSSDSRFYKMVKIGKKLLIETIDELSLIADVDVIVVPGNHDTNSMLMMGDILEAFYHTSKKVKIHNGPAPRKYYKYGRNGMMYTHGHNEKMSEMGAIFATEQKHLWADTDFHRVHMGHLHHQKQVKYKDVDEQLGCIVKIISSLSSNDAWHAEKAYLSLKGAEAFLYHRDKGLLANYYYYI